MCMDKVKDWLFGEEEEGYTEVVIWAFKNNLNAISFYRKHGYILEKEEYLGKPYLTMGVRLNKKI
mgnify:CR=1 FL=1